MEEQESVFLISDLKEIISSAAGVGGDTADSWN